MNRGLAAGALVCTLGIFLWFAGPGLWGGFMPDDLMNLHRAARMPAGDFVRGVFTPWAGEWRPFGFLFFKAMWTAFGFHPLPYHAVALALLMVNAGLLAALAWRLTGCAAAVAFTALFACHHGYFSDLYLNSGTMFDVLAGALALALLHLYIRQPRPGPWRCAALALLYLLALQTKEIALFVPAAVWACELLLRGGSTWRTARCAWVLTALAAVSAAGLAGGEMMGNTEYRPQWSPVAWLERWNHYLSFAFYLSEQPGVRLAVITLVAAAVLAWGSREPAARWAWVGAMSAPLPLLVITPRSFYAFYVPYLFWALLAGILTGSFARRWRWAPAALFILLAGVLVERHLWIRPHAERWYAGAVEEVRPALTLLPREAKRWPKGAVVLFLEDPYPADDYTMLYVASLASGDMSLVVYRVKKGADPAGDGLRYRMSSSALERVP